MNHIFSLVIAGFLALNLSAQITSEPQLPVANKAVTITFNSSEDSRLGYFTGDLYAHTGLTIEDKGDWQNVIANWGENDKQPKLTNKGDGIYELEISPDINTFFNVSAAEKITKINLVFRSADGSQQTNDLFIDVYEEGLVVQITEPETNSIVAINETVNITTSASIEADLKLFLNDSLLNENTGNTISTSYIFTESGTYWLIAEATTDQTIRDSVSISVRPAVVEQAKPSTYKKGINYTSDNSAALVLWATLKEFVYVIGDFNDWQISNDYLMKKDGDYFWLDVENLEKGKEYAFQYFINGSIKIADPYTEKILDPWNDSYISEETYPNLISYPENKTEGIVSVLQPGQEEYSWEVNDFQIPEKETLVIYELLIRDFTEKHTYSSIIEKLDYLEELNINVLELLPVNEFEGNSSWGYNPSFYFAPDKYYGPKNELKRLIDECHKHGIAVVIDMVLNHSYGESPFVQMYMENWVVTDENPWYNIESPNPVYSWGYDFNHESAATKELVDSVNSFWLNEYKVDGFRFDFTKGFTNMSGDGTAYDMSRIAILNRMADKIWEQNSDALVILEHLTGNSEEMALANYGMMLWGNMNHDYGETAMGYSANLSGGIYSNQGWNDPNLVSYMESHDEERLIYKCKNYGNANSNYNTKELATALNRVELNSVFFLPLPGPKMIWQFGELGYDYSINTCEDGSVNNDCRTAPKPFVWDYLEENDRTDLFGVMAKLNALKQSYEEFAPDNTEYSLASDTKWYKLSNNNKHVVGLGNFGIQQNNVEITFPTTGKYYEFFSGDSIEITSADQSFTFEAGEYRLYSTRQFDNPDITTAIGDIAVINSDVSIYPNPANSVVHFKSTKMITLIEIYSLSGELLIQETPAAFSSEINISQLIPAIYLTKIHLKNFSFSKKLVIK